MRETRPPQRFALRDPDGLDTDDPREVAAAVIADLRDAMAAVHLTTRRLTTHVDNSLMQDCLDAIPDCIEPAGYAFNTLAHARAERAARLIDLTVKDLRELSDELSQGALERHEK